MSGVNTTPVVCHLGLICRGIEDEFVWPAQVYACSETGFIKILTLAGDTPHDVDGSDIDVQLVLAPDRAKALALRLLAACERLATGMPEDGTP